MSEEPDDKDTRDRKRRNFVPTSNISIITLLASIRQLLVTIATIRLTSMPTSTFSLQLKSLVQSCQYIIALASVLILLIYIDHVASQSIEGSYLFSDQMSPSMTDSTKFLIGSENQRRLKRNGNFVGWSTGLRNKAIQTNTKTTPVNERSKNTDRTLTGSIESQTQTPARVQLYSFSKRSEFVRFEATRGPRYNEENKRIRNQSGNKYQQARTINSTISISPSTYRSKKHDTMEAKYENSPIESSSQIDKPSSYISRSQNFPNFNHSDQLTFRYSDAIIEPAQSLRRQNQRSRYNNNNNNNNVRARQHGSNMRQVFGARQGRLKTSHNNGQYLYKRVLICDKTLVSLDYMKNPNKFIGNDFIGNGIETDENFVDSDSGFEEFFSDRRSLNTSSDIDIDNVSYDYSSSSIEKRKDDNYPLTDEDALVRCDMWDLEKGLKNRKPPENLLRQAIRTDFNTVRDAINRCRQLSEKNLSPEDEFRDGVEVSTPEDMISMFSIKRGLIPGTKWCGLGDIANSYNDLGTKRRIDICCRAHDHCPIRLKPFRNDYGVFNIALYTKSHCDCDADFYRCLREAHSSTADMLGNLYFNVMKLQCIKEEPMKLCREIRPLALGFERCVKYEESLNKRIFRFSAPAVPY